MQKYEKLKSRSNRRSIHIGYDRTREEGQNRTEQDLTAQRSTAYDRLGHNGTGHNRIQQNSTGYKRPGQDRTGQDSFIQI